MGAVLETELTKPEDGSDVDGISAVDARKEVVRLRGLLKSYEKDLRNCVKEKRDDEWMKGRLEKLVELQRLATSHGINFDFVNSVDLMRDFLGSEDFNEEKLCVLSSMNAFGDKYILEYFESIKKENLEGLQEIIKTLRLKETGTEIGAFSVSWRWYDSMLQSLPGYLDFTQTIVYCEKNVKSARENFLNALGKRISLDLDQDRHNQQVELFKLQATRKNTGQEMIWEAHDILERYEKSKEFAASNKDDHSFLEPLTSCKNIRLFYAISGYSKEDGFVSRKKNVTGRLQICSVRLNVLCTKEASSSFSLNSVHSLDTSVAKLGLNQIYFGISDCKRCVEKVERVTKSEHLFDITCDLKALSRSRDFSGIFLRLNEYICFQNNPEDHVWDYLWLRAVLENKDVLLLYNLCERILGATQCYGSLRSYDGGSRTLRQILLECMSWNMDIESSVFDHEVKTKIKAKLLDLQGAFQDRSSSSDEAVQISLDIVSLVKNALMWDMAPKILCRTKFKSFFPPEGLPRKEIPSKVPLNIKPSNLEKDFYFAEEHDSKFVYETPRNQSTENSKSIYESSPKSKSDFVSWIQNGL